jgi:hypothetical protein
MSSPRSSLDHQIAVLRVEGCDAVFREKASEDLA